MTKRSSLRVVARRRSSQREQLAQAIAAHAAAVERVENVNRAADELRRRSIGAHRQADDAQRTIAKAASEQGAVLVGELLGREGTGRAAIEQTEAQLAKAKAQIAAAAAARPELEKERQAADWARKGAEDALRKTTCAVVQAETRAAIERELQEAKQLQTHLIERRSRLRALHLAGCIGEELEPRVRDFLRHNHDVLPGTIGSTEFSPENFNSHPAAMSVHSALEQLRADADAPAPI